MSGLRRYLPALAWLRSYQPAWRGRDLLAGITITALLVPEGMAYAQLAGVAPEAAFYAAPPALLMYALFGSSRRLVVVVSSTQAVFSAATISALAPAGTLEFVTLTSALAITAGVMAIVAGLLRLGRIAQFFSASVLTGFVSGLALVILVGQVPKVLGIEGVDGDFFEQLAGIIRELPGLDGPTTVVGIIAIAGMIALERIDERIPAPLVALLGGIVASVALGLDEHGVEVVGTLPAGLAGPRLPDVQLADIALLLSGAAGLTLLNFAEAYGPARELARERGEQVDPNQELIGLGAANAGAGLFQGFPIGASLSKTAAAAHAGMQTQLAGVFAAILVVAVALFLTPLFEPLPEAILGAIVIVAVSSMFKAVELRRLWRVGRADFALALIALAGVLVLNVLPGLLIAVTISLAVVVWRASSAGLTRMTLAGEAVVELEEAPGASTAPGVVVLRLDGPLFFANADTLLANVLGAGGDGAAVHALVLDLEATIDLDVPGADTIAELGRELAGMGIDLHLARVHPDALAVLERTGASGSVAGIHRRTLDAIRVAQPSPSTTGGND